LGDNQMQTPFEDGDITQTWERVNWYYNLT
jgi:hypothetical protein